jgi:serpin B
MKRLVFILLSAIMIFGLASCATPSVSASEIKSDKPRDTSPVVSGPDEAALVDGNSEFAWSLYQSLRAEEGNLFYSPYSISLALAMTYAGAKGETAQQMADTLHFTLSQAALHPAFNKLALELASRGEGAQGKDGEGFKLNVVNAIWGQKDYQFVQSFLDLLAINYGAGLRVLDFINNPSGSRDTINQWVSDQTAGEIKDLIPEGSITPLTRLVLTNAVYFNAAWETPFEPSMTKPGQFHLADGSEVTVDMMHNTDSFGYVESGNVMGVELPYDENELSMVILTNTSGSFSDFENGLTYAAVKDIINSIQYKEVNLTMPKFEFESEFGLKPTLQSMGMELPFLDTADFTGISTESDLHIDDVVHKAFISVDESGTEAAAATGVVVGTTSMPIEIKIVTLDQPFVFLIRDIQTGTILFIGRVMNPVS